MIKCFLTAAHVARSHVHVAPMSGHQQLAQSEAYARVPSCYQNVLHWGKNRKRLRRTGCSGKKNLSFSPFLMSLALALSTHNKQTIKPQQGGYLRGSGGRGSCGPGGSGGWVFTWVRRMDIHVDPEGGCLGRVRDTRGRGLVARLWWKDCVESVVTTGTIGAVVDEHGRAGKKRDQRTRARPGACGPYLISILKPLVNG
jgi:hypothetical protein